MCYSTYTLNSKVLHSQATETLNNVRVFKNDNASAGTKIPDKVSGKRRGKTSGVPSRNIRRAFNKWVFKEIPSKPLYTPDKNRF